MSCGQMGISRKGLSLFFRWAIISLAVCLIICLVCPPCFAPIRTVSASWAGWDSIDTIAIIPSSDEFLDTAAQELKTYLEDMSGRSWNIVQNDVSGPAIRLQVNPSAPEFTDRNDEAVRIISDVSGIRIIGKTSVSVRHGAYILLDKLGVRWFFKNDIWTVTPDSLADLGALDEVQEPDMDMRWPVHENQEDTDALKAWCRRNLMPGSVYYASSHNYSKIAPIATYYASYPEWYTGSAPSTPWQFDPYDNASLIARGVAYAQGFLDTAGGTYTYQNISDDAVIRGGVSFSPNDGGGFGPAFTTTQEITDACFYFANEVAKGIAVSHPDDYISLYNYYTHAMIPDLDMEPNVLAWVTDGTNWSPISTKDRFEGCFAKGMKTAIYQYTDEWVYHKDVPCTDSRYNHTKQIGAMQSMGATAYLSECADSWGGMGLVKWLMAELTWDASLDWDTLLADFYTNAFGPAATNMQAYFEAIRTTDNYAMKQAINYLDAAETDAVGNAAVLARIRYMQDYFYFVWQYYNVGYTTLSDGDLEALYTFCTNLRDLFTVYYSYVCNNTTYGIRHELITHRGYSAEEVNALNDFGVPTSGETETRKDAALAYFNGLDAEDAIQSVNPRKMTLTALGDTETAREDPLHTGDQCILIPSDGDETVTIRFKTTSTGYAKWYNPDDMWYDIQLIANTGGEWRDYYFDTDVAGTYILATAYTKLDGFSGYVDVVGRKAGILAVQDQSIFSGEESLSLGTSPRTWVDAETYFYVPAGTARFKFGMLVHSTFYPSGVLIAPSTAEHAFNFTVGGDTWNDMTIESPEAGLWKLDAHQTSWDMRFYFLGIPPVIWHDPEYLLVQGNSAPVANDQSVITTVDTPIDITLSASDLNGDPLTYAIVTSPSQGILSETPPVVTYTPNSGFVGSDNFTFKVNDSSADSNQATVSITITDNHYPIADAIGDKSVNEGEFLEYTISATDPDGDPLTYSVSNLPSGASFDPNNQTFSWAPRYDQAGVYSVHFEVYDGQLTDSEDVTITVVQLYEDWDINGDGAADVLDMVLVGQHWGEVGLTGWIREDANEDGTVNVLDMIIIGQNSTE